MPHPVSSKTPVSSGVWKGIKFSCSEFEVQPHTFERQFSLIYTTALATAATFRFPPSVPTVVASDLLQPFGEGFGMVLCVIKQCFNMTFHEGW